MTIGYFVSFGSWAHISKNTKNTEKITPYVGPIAKVGQVLYGINKYDSLKNEIESYIKDFKGKYGIYYYNINNKDEFSINDKLEYSAASTLKIPLNLYLFSKMEKGEVNPDSTIKYSSVDYEEGTGSLQFEDLEGGYKVSDLSRLSIVNSDNIAGNIYYFHYVKRY